MAALEFEKPPPKNHCFAFNAPKGASSVAIIDGLQDVVGQGGGLKVLQHQGGSRFCAAVANAEAAAKLSARGAVVINGVSTPVACLDSRIIYVTVYRLRPHIRDEDLAAALTPYGTVLAVQPPNFQVRPRTGDGTRLVRIQIKHPIPNFLRVLGCRVQCEYKGVKRLCFKCEMEGHMGRQCPAPWCELCWASGHDNSSCPASACDGAGTPGQEVSLPDDIVKLQERFMSCDMQSRNEGAINSSEGTALTKKSEQGVTASFSRDSPTEDAPTVDESSQLSSTAVRAGRAEKKKASSSATIV